MQSVSGSRGGYLSRRHFHNIQMRGEGETEARNGGYGEQRYSAGWWEGGLGEPDGDRGCESGVVCRGMVLPADIFIGGHATCNRARGIRTERCFAHLYPRSGDSPVRRPFPVRSTLALREPFFYSLSARANRAQSYPDIEPRGWHIGRFAFFGCSLLFPVADPPTMLQNFPKFSTGPSNQRTLVVIILPANSRCARKLEDPSPSYSDIAKLSKAVLPDV